MTETPDNLPFVGWRERVDLPEWGIKRLLAKIDTGAATSALDVAWLEELEDDVVRFEVVVHRKQRGDKKYIAEAPIVRRAKVRSSSGHLQDRIIVATRLKLGPIRKPIELSLVKRPKMICRMLLGRAALEGACYVDVRHRHLLSQKRVKKRPEA